MIYAAKIVVMTVTPVLLAIWLSLALNFVLVPSARATLSITNFWILFGFWFTGLSVISSWKFIRPTRKVEELPFKPIGGLQ